MQRVVIAGGHGQIALHLTRILHARGISAVGLIRNPDHADDVREAGGEPVVADLESAAVEEIASVLRGADAAVFAAGAGPGSGVARKETVDHAASVLMADAAESAGVRRFIQISSFGAGEPIPDGMDEVFAAYLRAKSAAEADLVRRDLDWTIVRPGRLTNNPATGLVRLEEPTMPKGDVTREDVAAVIAALLPAAGTAHTVLLLTEGDTAVSDAVARVNH
ncbi:NAD(P)H-binding protein [Hoyosella sp. YIM 151337]|uniref:NAD(P)H-binding protein n=1 Tax=Hoyosella sp. YIM 151337 TaxID=2992742 RepID=UPI0022360473|nr:NAD(P)H-binding protein [Hoyosella sp. YIM 151337]MCW4353768.1 NAD(P)H-binding protein [Hoyosella sp. YIM 151337]